MLRHGSAIPLGDDVEGLVMIEGRLVTAGVTQSVILVCQVKQPPLDRDLLTDEPVRVAAAVVAFMVTESDALCHAEAHVIAYYLCAISRVQLHQFKLLRCQRARFFKYPRGEMHLADVMEDRLCADQRDEQFRHPDLFCHNRAVGPDPQDMIAGVVIICLSRPGERKDGIGEGALGFTDLF